MNIYEKITWNFSWWEFVKKEDWEKFQKSSKMKENVIQLAHVLEGIRACLGGRPITITSGYRTLEHNRAIGGSPNSKHLTAEAVDFTVRGLSARSVATALKEWPGGLGLYPKHVHIDLRETKARW